MPWSQDWLDACVERWDWERLSANPALFAAVGAATDTAQAAAFVNRYADQWNWATLSGQASLPWSQGLYRLCADTVFPHLVAQHQDFGVATLGADVVAGLLEDLDSGKILPGMHIA
jgi:hypothetical protein